MNIRLLVSFAAGLALALACSQSGNPPATLLSGVNATVASGQFLFVTSTASNELRVLNLQPTGNNPVDYARAPNPLNSLSVPTLGSPIDLATPTRYGPLGQPLTGDWIFARGAGNPSVSVIGAVNCPQQLREFGRVTPRADAVVTAMASRLSTDDTLAYLYLATFDGEASTLWEFVFPNQPRVRTPATLGGIGIDPKTCPKYPSSMPAYTMRAIAPIPGAVVTSLAALPTVWNPKDDRNPNVPGPLPEEPRLVVATRLLALPPASPGEPTEEGVITVLDPTGAGSVSPYDLVFNPNSLIGTSFPVKKLLTHGNVVRVTFNNNNQDAGITGDGLGIYNGTAEVVMDAGTRVFGLLDEASCAGQEACQGLLAIDLDRPATAGGYLPIATDGMDNLRDVLTPDGGRVRLPDGGIYQAGDTYYRPPPGSPVADSNRMLPIKFGNGFATGIFQDAVLQSSGTLQYFDGVQTSYLPYGLLGVATISGSGGSNILAQIFVFDAMTLRQINFTASPPQITAQKAVLSQGALAIFDGGPTDVVVGQGVWRFSESIFTLYEGIVSGVAGEPLDAGLGNPSPPDGSPSVWPISINNRNSVELFVRPGDLVVPLDSTLTECLFAFPILPNHTDGGVVWQDERGVPFLHTRPGALGPDLADGGFFPDGGPTVASGCPPPVAYNIRSSGLSPGPFTVSGRVSGYLGRVALPDAGGVTTFTAGANSDPAFPRFWRPSVDAGISAATLSSVGFQFNLRDRTDQNGVFQPAVEGALSQGDVPELRGSGYQIDILNGFAPGSVGIDQTTLGIPLLLPGAMALYQRQVYPFPILGADRIFVLYPSANAILDFSPTTVTYTALNSADIGLHF